MNITFYHNPRCSKSRAVEALLRDQDVPVDVIEYLRTPFTRDALETMIQQLNVPSAKLIRTASDDFKKLGLKEAQLNDQKVVEILMEHPSLFQRPVVLYKQKARIGRPPESILEMLK